MNIQYFKSAWGDIKNSPGWFGKLCLLALLNFIPIFGQIVTYAYLYGWAREIAWGTHEPLPKKIFSNEDGKFWRRGWFAFVLTFVFALVPYIVAQVGNYCQMQAFVGSYVNAHAVANPMLNVLGNVLVFAGFVGMLLTAVLAWIGIMRISIYDRLSAGFQLGKIWKMLRHDTTGVLKIFGMSVLFNFIFGIILFIFFMIIIFIVVFAGVSGLMSAGYSPQAVQNMTQSQSVVLLLQIFASSGFVGFIAILAGVFVVLVAAVFVRMLVARAIGYWTMQFDVPKWRGQDDPMPFEVSDASYAQQPPVYPVAPMRPYDQPQTTQHYDQVQSTQQYSQAQSGQPMQTAGPAQSEQPYSQAQPMQPQAPGQFSQVPQPMQPQTPEQFGQAPQPMQQIEVDPIADENPAVDGPREDASQ